MSMRGPRTFIRKAWRSRASSTKSMPNAFAQTLRPRGELSLGEPGGCPLSGRASRVADPPCTVIRGVRFLADRRNFDSWRRAHDLVRPVAVFSRTVLKFGNGEAPMSWLIGLAVAAISTAQAEAQPDRFAYKLEVTPEEGHRDPAIQMRYTPAFNACQKHARKTYEYDACFAAEFIRQDAALNRTWKVTFHRVA